MYLNRYKQHKNDGNNNNGDNDKNKNDDNEDDNNKKTIIITKLIVIIIKILFQPGDFSAGSTTAYNHDHNILTLLEGSANFPFTTSETKRYY